MRGSRTLFSILTAGTLLLTPAAAGAQDAPATTADADRRAAPTAEARAAQDEFDRREIGRLLRRPGVGKVARTAGVDVEGLETAVSDLSRRELRDVGERARDLNDDLDDDADTVVISTTTIIIALLVLIVILVA